MALIDAYGEIMSTPPKTYMELLDEITALRTKLESAIRKEETVQEQIKELRLKLERFEPNPYR